MSGFQQAGQTQSIVQEARLRLHRSAFRLIMGIGSRGNGGRYQFSVGDGMETSSFGGQTASVSVYRGAPISGRTYPSIRSPKI